MHVSRFLIGALALSFLVAGFGCKTGKSGAPPVSNPIVTFTPPDREDVFPDETETDDGPDDGGGEDFGSED